MLKIIVQHSRFIGEHRERRIIAHGTNGLDAILGHRRDHDPLIFVRITESNLPLQQRLVVRLLHGRGLRQITEMDEMRIEPLPVGARIADLILDLFVLNNPPLLRIDEKHAAGLNAAFLHDIGRRKIEHARF